MIGNPKKAYLNARNSIIHPRTSFVVPRTPASLAPLARPSRGAWRPRKDREASALEDREAWRPGGPGRTGRSLEAGLGTTEVLGLPRISS